MVHPPDPQGGDPRAPQRGRKVDRGGETFHFSLMVSREAPLGAWPLVFHLVNDSVHHGFPFLLEVIP